MNMDYNYCLADFRGCGRMGKVDGVKGVKYREVGQGWLLICFWLHAALHVVDIQKMFGLQINMQPKSI